MSVGEEKIAFWPHHFLRSPFMALQNVASFSLSGSFEDYFLEMELYPNEKFKED